MMIADEIQCGLGRTGKLFYSDFENVIPDMYILGKALSGGFYPVSAIAANTDIMDVFHPGDHGSTFGANPLACAVAYEALSVLEEENLTARAKEQGDYFMQKLRAIASSKVREVRGAGLLIGVELTAATGRARPFCEALMKRGILCKETHESVIRFAPPLVITKEDIDWAIEHVREVLA
jgi:ornithine--oxo-acid transaminase